MPELVDRDGLEIRRLRKGSEGSNPSLSSKGPLLRAFFFIARHRAALQTNSSWLH